MLLLIGHVLFYSQVFLFRISPYFVSIHIKHIAISNSGVITAFWLKKLQFIHHLLVITIYNKILYSYHITIIYITIHSVYYTSLKNKKPYIKHKE